jgi:hypothetical protein
MKQRRPRNAGGARHKASSNTKIPSFQKTFLQLKMAPHNAIENTVTE